MCAFCSQAAFQTSNYSAEAASNHASRADGNGIASGTSTGNNNIDGLLSGYKWDTTSLTWRIPTSSAQYDTDPIAAGIQYSDIDRANGWLPPTATMTTATSTILNSMFGGVSGLTFTAVAAGDLNADLTIGRAAAVAGDFETAYAYYPTGPGSSESGDSWFSNSYDADPLGSQYTTPILGGYAWTTYIHEFGHNMGLKHGHETGGVTNTAMNADWDSMEFSVMTYRSYFQAPVSGGYTNEDWGYAQSLMMYDIAALQFLYGADFTTNAIASTYTFSTTTGEMSINGVGQGTPGGNRIFRTVWDGNGIDTYDFSNYATNLIVDLTPGGWSVLSSVQIANLGSGNFARGNLFNALQFNGDIRSLIENAVGGSGNDNITGNAANNTLYGRAGMDTISGGAGADTIYGGIAAADPTDLADTLFGNTGNDLIYGNGGADVIYGGADTDTIYGGAGADTIYGGNAMADPTDLADTIYGNTGNDLIYGNGGADIIFGGEDTDTIYGGAGADTIYGGTAAADPTDLADTIYGNSGNDLIYGNGGADTIFGDEDTDTVYGGAGIDTIYGGTGNDVLYGNTEADRFVFNTVLNASTNVDAIMDFAAGVDDIYLSQAIFGGIGAMLDASEFQIGAADAATDRILYNQANGQLFYDADGNGTGASTLFATVTANTVLTINDFVMVGRG